MTPIIRKSDGHFCAFSNSRTSIFSKIQKLFFQNYFQKQQQNRKKRPDLPKEWQPSNNGSDQYFQIRNFEEIHVFKDSNLSDDEEELEGLGSPIL